MSANQFQGVFPYLVSPPQRRRRRSGRRVHSSRWAWTGSWQLWKPISPSRKAALSDTSVHIPLCVLLIGGVGWMAGPTCIILAQSVRLYDLAMAKKWEEAMLLQRGLWMINQVFAKYSLAACIKTGLALQGFEVGDPLPPQEPLSEKARDEIRRALKMVEGL